MRNRQGDDENSQKPHMRQSHRLLAVSDSGIVYGLICFLEAILDAATTTHHKLPEKVDLA